MMHIKAFDCKLKVTFKNCKMFYLCLIFQSRFQDVILQVYLGSLWSVKLISEVLDH